MSRVSATQALDKIINAYFLKFHQSLPYTSLPGALPTVRIDSDGFKILSAEEATHNGKVISAMKRYLWPSSINTTVDMLMLQPTRQFISGTITETKLLPPYLDLSQLKRTIWSLLFSIGYSATLPLLNTVQLGKPGVKTILNHWKLTLMQSLKPQTGSRKIASKNVTSSNNKNLENSATVNRRNGRKLFT